MAANDPVLENIRIMYRRGLYPDDSARAIGHLLRIIDRPKDAKKKPVLQSEMLINLDGEPVVRLNGAVS